MTHRTMSAIDLNADMGEYADDEGRANETALMPLVSSCSIACGGHAGDARTMQLTARLAKQHGVATGAHPSYPDRSGFGRRSIKIDAPALTASLVDQLNTLHHILDTERLPTHHVKPHGALYNDAATDITLARLILRAMKSVSSEAPIYGPPNSALAAAAKEANVAFIAEGFVDRSYLASGALAPRSAPDAVITDNKARAAQALAIARRTPFSTIDGTLTICVKTLCIHSDSPGAVEAASAVRAALEQDGISIRADA